MSKNLKEKLAAYGMVLPAFLVVMLTVAYPIVSAVIQSFQDGSTGGFTLANYAYFFTDEIQRMNLLYTNLLLRRTAMMVIGIAAISLSVGLYRLSGFGVTPSPA